MAKKSVSAKRDENKVSKIGLLKSFFTGERTNFIVGLLLCIFSLYVGLSLISFLFTGGADQSKIENVPFWPDLALNKGAVENWTGSLGAYISDILMNRWFGISTLFMVYFVASVGARLMRLRRIPLLKRFLFCASSMICGSILLAFLFVKGYEDTFLYLGGRHGYVISEFMITNLGVPGTLLILLGIVAIIAVCSSKRVIPALQNLLSFGWLPKFRKKKAESAPVAENNDESQNVFDTQKEIEEAEEISKKRTETEELQNDSKPVIQTVSEEPVSEDIIPEETYQKEDTEENIPEENIESVEADTEQKEENAEKQASIIDDPTFNVEIMKEEETDYEGKELGDYDPRLDLSRYVFPTIDLLRDYDTSNCQVSQEDLYANQQLIKQALEDFSISIASIKTSVGPTVTLYEIVPAAGVRISKIKTLEDDIALSLSALQIRIIAPMPGKGTIGIEVPNRNPQTVSMQSVIASRKFQECKYDLPVAIG